MLAKQVAKGVVLLQQQEVGGVGHAYCEVRPVSLVSVHLRRILTGEGATYL